MKKSTLTALPLLLLASACGGGGGSTGGGTVVTPTPTPTPTPLPSPAPIVGDANWSTFQRDPGHTGYVPGSFSAASFADVWTVTTPYHASPIAARPGTVFFNFQQDLHVYTRAVSTSDGSSLWTFDLGMGAYVAGPFGPSYANGRVASMAQNNSSSTAASLQVINATTGAYISSPTYDAQGSVGTVPTPVGDELFYAAGYYGNVVFNANAATGDRLWRTAVDMAATSCKRKA